jgi:hypothetical protein
VLPTADAFRYGPPGLLTEREWLKRQFINELAVEQQRLICAAGRLLYTGLTLHRIRRRFFVADSQTHAMIMAKTLLREMFRLFNAPRIKSVRALVALVTGGKPPSLRQMQNLAKANPSGT